MKAILIVLGLAALTTFFVLVDRNEKSKPGVDLPPANQTGRFTLVRQGTVGDPDAYNQKRGVYILTDNQTGKEYIGVSGIGISELGSGVKAIPVER